MDVNTDLDSSERASKFSDFFIFKKELGEGSFGRVVAAVYLKTGQECAVKVIRKKSTKAEYMEQITKEAEILSSLRHPNIIKFLDMKETEKRIFIVMELIEGGNLNQLMDDRKAAGIGFSDQEASLIMKCIFQGVSYIHTHNFIHRDIKPENILIKDPSDLSSLKIADFGLSTQFAVNRVDDILTVPCGTVCYMAPEIAQKKSYTNATDIWSCGIILYMLITGNHPLYKKEDTTKTLFAKLVNPQWDLSHPNFTELSRNLFLKLMKKEVRERYTVEIALMHPWITQRKEDDIPLSGYETMQCYDQKQKLGKLFKAMHFLSYLVVKSGENAEKLVQPSYRQLVDKMSDEIEQKAVDLEKPATNVLTQSFLADLFGRGTHSTEATEDTQRRESLSPKKEPMRRVFRMQDLEIFSKVKSQSPPKKRPHPNDPVVNSQTLNIDISKDELDNDSSDSLSIEENSNEIRDQSQPSSINDGTNLIKGRYPVKSLPSSRNNLKSDAEDDSFSNEFKICHKITLPGHKSERSASQSVISKPKKSKVPKGTDNKRSPDKEDKSPVSRSHFRDTFYQNIQAAHSYSGQGVRARASSSTGFRPKIAPKPKVNGASFLNQIAEIAQKTDKSTKPPLNQDKKSARPPRPVNVMQANRPRSSVPSSVANLSMNSKSIDEARKQQPRKSININMNGPRINISSGPQAPDRAKARSCALVENYFSLQPVKLELNAIVAADRSNMDSRSRITGLFPVKSYLRYNTSSSRSPTKVKSNKNSY